MNPEKMDGFHPHAMADVSACGFRVVVRHLAKQTRSGRTFFQLQSSLSRSRLHSTASSHARGRLHSASTASHPDEEYLESGSPLAGWGVGLPLGRLYARCLLQPSTDLLHKTPFRTSVSVACLLEVSGRLIGADECAWHWSGCVGR